MPTRTSKTGSELFIVDNSDTEWKVLQYLHDWCDFSKAIDIATGYFEIGSLLALGEEWKKVEHIRILMGDEVSLRTRDAFAAGVANIKAPGPHVAAARISASIARRIGSGSVGHAATSAARSGSVIPSSSSRPGPPHRCSRHFHWYNPAKTKQL